MMPTPKGEINITKPSHFLSEFNVVKSRNLFWQVGLSRSTTGCVAACQFREFQLAASYEGLIETVPGVNLGLLKVS